MARYKPEEAAIRKEYSRITAKLRRKYKTLQSRAPTAKILGSVDLIEYMGPKELKASGVSLSLKEMRNITAKAKQLLDSGAFSVIARKRAVNSAIENMHENGNTWVNEDNIDVVLDFMERMRELGIVSAYSSNYLISVLGRGIERGLSGEDMRKNFERWARNVEKGYEKKLTLRKYKKRR